MVSQIRKEYNMTTSEHPAPQRDPRKPNRASPSVMTRAQRQEWSNLSKAYDCGSNDRRLSLAEFKRVWQRARTEGLIHAAD